MLLHQPSQIMAMLRSGKMINIGGRPVIVPKPRTPANARARSHAIKLALAFVTIYVIWGSTYLAIRYAVETIPPLVTAGIRHSIAGGVMLAWAWWRGFRPTRQQWVAGFALGALFFLIGHGTLHWAEQYVGSGLAALLIATEPMFILVLGWMMGQQRISLLSALGLGLGVVGVAMLTGAELSIKGSSLWGLLAVLLGSLSWSLGVVFSPRLRLPSDALGRTALPTLCGAAMLLIAAGITGEFQQTHWSSITLRSIFGLGYLITFGSVVAFTAYTWLLQRVPPALVATHTYANPVVAVILGWLLAHEHLSLRVVLASIAILGAIVLIRRGERAVAVKSPQVVSAAAEIQSSEECA
ncbi:MAG TPA: EamA family transporter [Candidatus Dormibacteraeota bacterium]|jgi:drug/metabolite transporter (DMT)-like permease|nr:EamA family transporter [Candidatus Dormibacteraeota bacterium]